MLFRSYDNKNPLKAICERTEPKESIINNISDINVDTYNNKTYISLNSSIPSNIEFKTSKNIAAAMKNISNSISKIFKTLNNILNIKGE